MKENFLHILKVNSGSNNGPDPLASYYYSSSLIEDIASLITREFDHDMIHDRKILLKPNWVKHSSVPDDELCLRTHEKFVIAVLKAVLSYGPREITIGDAPIQGCKWDQMMSESLLDEISNLSCESGIPVNVKDFRRRVYVVSENAPRSELKPISDYVIFDLGKDSFLEPVTRPGTTQFRVTNYDPDRMSLVHSPGTHKYCITKSFFEADIVIQLPKIKTHQKTGITGALKNLVGINGDKDFLPHHRIGGIARGGDCYPGDSVLRYWSELSIDKANRRQGTTAYWIWQKLSSLLWRISIPGNEHNIEAGWYGNDTSWRMVMDLNKIGRYGTIDGSISDREQRRIYSICDAIVAGQGDGPLNPEPIDLGIISFTDNSAVNDQIMALLMEIPVEKVPLLNNIASVYNKECRITFNGEMTDPEALKKHSVKAVPPKGWIAYLSN